MANTDAVVVRVTRISPTTVESGGSVSFPRGGEFYEEVRCRQCDGKFARTDAEQWQRFTRTCTCETTKEQHEQSGTI
jgi:hypothetical protein